MVEQIILVGWKDICAACGVKSKKTMKKKAKKYHLPIKILNNKPEIPKFVLIEWYNNLPTS